MTEKGDVFQLVERVRAGDAAATAEFVNTYEQELRRRCRVWLRVLNPRVQRLVDSTDVCQSVLAKFFVLVALGQFDFERPEQVQKLLFSMAHNKVRQLVRNHQAQRRDIRRQEDLPGEEWRDLGDGHPNPSRLVAGKELLAEFRRRLPAEECQLADLRIAGRSWSEVAAQHGGTAEGRRKQLERAIDRIARDLGLQGDSDDRA